MIVFGALILSGLLMTDLGRFQAQIEHFVEQRLGRQLAISGPLHIHLGKQLRINVQGLKLANPPGANDPWLAEVAQADLVIDSMSLLRGPMVIEDARLSGVKLSLEVDERGKSSWQLVTSAEPPETTAGSLDVLPKTLRISDSSIRYTNATNSADVLVLTDQLDQDIQADGMLKLLLKATVNGVTLRYTGDLGPMASLLSARDVQFTGEGQLGEVVFSGNGVIDSLVAPKLPRLNVTVSGPDLAMVEKLLPLHNVPEQAFQAEVAMQPANNQLDIRLKAQTSDLTVELQGTTRALDDIGALEAQLNANGTDLGAYAQLFGLESLPNETFSVQAQIRKRDAHIQVKQLRADVGPTHVVMNGELNQFPYFNDGSAKLQISGPDLAQLRELLNLPGVASGPFEASFELNHGDQGRDPFSLRLQTQLLLAQFAGTFGPGPGYSGSAFTVQAQSDNPLALFKPYGLAFLPDGPMSLNASLSIDDHGLHWAPESMVTVGDHRLQAEGFVSWRPETTATDLNFTLDGSSLETLTGQFVKAPLLTGNYALKGQVRHTADALELSKLSLALDAFTTTGQLNLKPPLDGSAMGYSLELQGQNIRDLPLPGEPGWLLPNPFTARIEGNHQTGVWTLERGHLELGSARIDLNGRLNTSPGEDAFTAEFQISNVHGPELVNIKKLNLAGLPLNGAGKASGNRQKIHLENIDLNLGRSNLAGQADVRFDRDVPEINLTARSRLIDLTELVPARNKDQAAAQAPPPTPERLVPDLKVSQAWLQRLNADIAVDIEQLITAGPTFTGVELVSGLNNGQLKLAAQSDVLAGGSVSTRLELKRQENAPPLLEFLIETDQYVPHQAARLSADDPDPFSISLNFDADGRGNTLREVAGTLNGHLRVDVGPTILPPSFLKAIELGVVEMIFNAILPKKPDKQDNNLHCLVVRVDISDGTALAKPGGLLVTDNVQVVSLGTIDLSTEQLDLSFETLPNKMLRTNISELLINPYFRVAGTLAKPQLVLNKEKALVYGGAASATAGLSILAKSVFDRLKQSKNPCEQFQEEDTP